MYSQNLIIKNHRNLRYLFQKGQLALFYGDCIYMHLLCVWQSLRVLEGLHDEFSN